MTHSIIVYRHRDRSEAGWDENYQRYKRGNGELEPLSDEEYATGQWVDVTAMSDPMGMHIYIRIQGAD